MCVFFDLMLSFAYLFYVTLLLHMYFTLSLQHVVVQENVSFSAFMQHEENKQLFFMLEGWWWVQESHSLRNEADYCGYSHVADAM